MPVHRSKDACEGGGRDEDSPATIYLILVVMATQPEEPPCTLDSEAGNKAEEGGMLGKRRCGPR